MNRMILCVIIFSQLSFAQWIKVDPVTSLDQKMVCYSGEDVYILCDKGTVYKYSGNTRNWKPIKFPTDACLSKLSFVDEQMSFIVGEYGNIYKTSDSWKTYEDISLSPQYHIMDAIFDISGTAIVVGSKEIIVDGNKYRIPSIQLSTEMGLLWNPIEFNHLRGSINSVAVFRSTIYAAGDFGKIYKSEDFGRSWSVESLPVSSNLNSINVFADYILTGGEKGTLFYSTDFGTQWNNISVSSDYNLKHICFDGDNKIAASGHKEVRVDGKIYNMAVILNIIPGFNIWNEEYSQIEGSYNYISFYNPLKGIAVGDKGIMAVYNQAKLMEADYDNLNFKIQNFPNPFNPSTTINYTLPKKSRVTIKIFDILGNKIQTLVQEVKPAGHYEITWDASGEPSGVYFCHLKSGNFVETRKMILMR